MKNCLFFLLTFSFTRFISCSNNISANHYNSSTDDDYEFDFNINNPRTRRRIDREIARLISDQTNRVTGDTFSLQPHRMSLNSYNSFTSITLYNYSLMNLFIDSTLYLQLNTTPQNDRGEYVPLSIGLAYDFDTSETEFLKFIRKISFESFPVGTSYYGKFFDPMDGKLRYFFLPILINLADDPAPFNDEADFFLYMQKNSTPAQVHLTFPDQETLFSSSPLDSEILRAFEVDFPVFLLLISKYPQKYYLPALALALQYDQDFYKFLSLFFVVKDYYKTEIDYQSFFITIFLEMRIVSKAAFEFFSNSSNSVFFFSEFFTHPCYYGKFSPHIVADIISKHVGDPDFDQAKNHLSEFLFNFNYSALINRFYMYKKFARINFKFIFRYESLFKSPEEFNLAIYQLYKSSIDESKYFQNMLWARDKVKDVLKVALKMEDFVIIRHLFINFELEQTNDQVYFRNFKSFDHNLLVKVQKINNRFCTVNVRNGKKTSVTIILPIK